MEKLILPHPRSDTKKSGKESRWRDILSYYDKKIEEFSKNPDALDVLAKSSSLVMEVLRKYHKYEPVEAQRIMDIQSVNTWADGGEVLVKLVELVNDLEIQSRP